MISLHILLFKTKHGHCGRMMELSESLRACLASLGTILRTQWCRCEPSHLTLRRKLKNFVSSMT